MSCRSSPKSATEEVGTVLPATHYCCLFRFSLSNTLFIDVVLLPRYRFELFLVLLPSCEFYLVLSK